MNSASPSRPCISTSNVLQRSIPEKFDGAEEALREGDPAQWSDWRTVCERPRPISVPISSITWVSYRPWSGRFMTSLRGVTEMEVDFQTLGLKKRLNPKIELALYRLFQECMTNISKHAKATRVEIMLTYSHPRVIFIVRDNGVGHDPSKRGAAAGKAPGGIGLLSMRERVASLGGSIDIASSPGKGTTIRAEIPVG